MSIEELRAERIKKLKLLEEKGINPYPISSARMVSIQEVLEKFDLLFAEEESLAIAGRIMAIREHGGSAFLDLYDGTARIQVFLKRDEIGQELFDLFQKTLDIGDFIDVAGKAMITKRGEPSVLVREWEILTKSLRPLPEKWHGLQDTEAKLRNRYLDILFDESLQELFQKKALFWDVTRSFLKERGFLEVETPTLEVTTGGAEARPFKTHHNDFNMDIFLRISVGELWQKRLMAGGIPRTFEIGRAYRNEGSSPEHVQEFTNMEFYAAYMGFDEGKTLVQTLYREIAEKVFGITRFATRGHTFDLADDWEELDYVTTVEKITGVNVLEAPVAELEKKLAELEVSFEGTTRERLADTLWKYCRKQISGPAFLVNHPKLVAPLSKENPTDSRLTKTFQVIIAGSEIGRAHAELNDPIDQEERFDLQQKLIEKGDDEAMMSDTDFVEMLEYGMPPTFGFGFGERFFAFLVDRPVREAQLFPLMKPKR
jgi:lysyl-tRNA synthetase class 2